MYAVKVREPSFSRSTNFFFAYLGKERACVESERGACGENLRFLSLFFVASDAAGKGMRRRKREKKH